MKFTIVFFISINNKLTINNSQIRGTNKDYYIKWDKGIKDKGIYKRDVELGCDNYFIK